MSDSKKSSWPWVTSLFVVVASVFSLSVLVNGQLDISGIDSKRIANIRTYNNIIQLISIVFATIIATSYATRKFGCKETTSGKSFIGITQLSLVIFTLTVLVMSIMILIDGNLSLLQNTNVKTYVIIQLMIMFGLSGYVIYGFFAERLNKKSGPKSSGGFVFMN